MAASLKRIDYQVLRKIHGFRGPVSYSRLRQFSTTVKDKKTRVDDREAEKPRTEDDRVPQVGMSPDGQVLICWHPEPTHPYEHTKPLPRTEQDLVQGESVLNPRLLKREEIKHRPHGPTVAELSNLFFTSKHRWYGQTPRRKALKKMPQNVDRDSI